MIWDLHCHLNGFSGRTPHERIAQMILCADRMGIDRLCVYMGMSFEYDPPPDLLRQQNDEVMQALEHWRHRAFGFVYLNPNHLEFSLREFDRCVRDGPMVGVKLWTARRAREPEPCRHESRRDGLFGSGQQPPPGVANAADVLTHMFHVE